MPAAHSFCASLRFIYWTFDCVKRYDFPFAFATIAYCFFTAKRIRGERNLKTNKKIMRLEPQLSSVQSKFNAVKTHFGFICFRSRLPLLLFHHSRRYYPLLNELASYVNKKMYWMLDAPWFLLHAFYCMLCAQCSLHSKSARRQANAREWKNYGSIYVKRFDPNWRRWMRSRWQCNAAESMLSDTQSYSYTALVTFAALHSHLLVRMCSMEINQMNVKSFWHLIHMSCNRILFGKEHKEICSSLVWWDGTRTRRRRNGSLRLERTHQFAKKPHLSAAVCFYHFDMI